MLEELFSFPIIMIDGENEERKQQESMVLNKGSEGYDIVFGEAEYPYWDFIGIEDRWIPTEESFNKALSGKFEACTVRFANVGQLLVPWSKKKFKAELLKFSDAYDKIKPAKPNMREIKIVNLTQEEYKKEMEDGKDGQIE